MNNINNSMKYQSRNVISKERQNIGLILFLPIILLVIIFMIMPLIITFFRSFTKLDLLNGYEVIMFENYLNILKDEPTQKMIVNTLYMLLFSAPLAIGISFLLAWLSSRINKVNSYILSVLFLLVSVTSITPAGLVWFISSIGGKPQQTLYSPLFNHILSLLIPIFIGLGPMYLIFTIGYMMKGNLWNYLQVAVTLQIVICPLTFFSVRTYAGFPSVNYSADNLVSAIFDYSYIRLDLGYASALMIILVILLIVFTIIFNLAVWLIRHAIKRFTVANNKINLGTSDDEKGSAKSIIISTVLIAFAALLLLPFFLMLLKTNPNNYRLFISRQGSVLVKVVFNSLFSLIPSTMILAFISIVSSIGFFMLSPRVKKVLVPFVLLTLVLSPIAILYYDRNFVALVRRSVPFNAVNAILKSSSVGLCIFSCSVIVEHIIGGDGQTGRLLISTKQIIRCLVSVLAISLLASLASWFNPMHMVTSKNNDILFSLYNRVASASINNLDSNALLLINLIIPICMIVVLTPLLLISLNKPNFRDVDRPPASC